MLKIIFKASFYFSKNILKKRKKKSSQQCDMKLIYYIIPCTLDWCKQLFIDSLKFLFTCKILTTKQLIPSHLYYKQ